jgi:hypothetical protein
VLRLDTRITNHGFVGTHPTTVQSVFQAGTAVLIDVPGVPRVRGLSGNPLTTPITLTGRPKLVGTPWPGYRPGALAEVRPTTAVITNFALVDVVTGQPFNRPAGTTGTSDTPHTQLVAPPQPAPTTPQGAQPTPTTGQAPQLDIAGTYLYYRNGGSCGPNTSTTLDVSHQGNTLTMVLFGHPYTGTLGADGSFEVIESGHHTSLRGVFATEGGRTIIRDGTAEGIACTATYTATKQ